MQQPTMRCMAKGWRKAIEANLGKVAGCTHMRELLMNMATAAFQSIGAAFSTGGDTPPLFLGECQGWRFDGPAVAEHFPKFIGYLRPEPAGKPPHGA